MATDIMATSTTKLTNIHQQPPTPPLKIAPVSTAIKGFSTLQKRPNSPALPQLPAPPHPLRPGSTPINLPTIKNKRSPGQGPTLPARLSRARSLPTFSVPSFTKTSPSRSSPASPSPPRTRARWPSPSTDQSSLGGNPASSPSWKVSS